MFYLHLGYPAGIAQLVEHDLAKVGVEGPSPFSRSKMKKTPLWCLFYFLSAEGLGPETPRGRGCGTNRVVHEVREADL